MQRKQFLIATLLAAPGVALSKSSFMQSQPISNNEPFIVDNGQSRFGDTIKFLGVHPNDLKVSSKDTDGQLSVFEYIGFAKVGPMLHMHFEQDEIFMVTEGKYRFVVGKETHEINAGQTIFLPRGVPHTWIQLSDYGKMIYMLQPAGKMEEFFVYMNGLKERPSAEEMDRIHAEHKMKVVGPPLSL